MTRNKMDFKKDILFKNLFSSYNEDSFRLIEICFKELFDVEVGNLNIVNTDIIPDNEDGKEVRLDVLLTDDQSKIYHMEMQNYGSIESYINRLKYYISSIVYHLKKRGQKLDVLKTVYSISFLSFTDEKFPFSFFHKSIYIDDQGIICHNKYDNQKALVYISNIKNIVKEKGIENLNNFEIFVYILYYGLDDGIIKLDKEVVRIMERRASLFTENELIELANIQLETQHILMEEEKQIQRKKGREEGLEEGREEGRVEGMIKGEENTKKRLNELYQSLKQENRIDDLLRATTDLAYQDQLLKEYKLQ